ncbi:MAG: hypothetical protein AB1763_07405 [Campylobacterota bacterium]
MKVESSSIAMESKHESKREVQSSFEALLESDAPSAEAVQRVKSEQELIEQFHFTLLLRLLDLLQGRTCKRERFCADETSEAFDLAPFRNVRERLTYTETTSLSEKLEVSMKGCVKTDRGEIALDLNLSLSHSFVQTRQITKEDFIDPLVIHVGGEFPALSSSTFRFDIDSDGIEDEIARLGEGSFFLALDRDGSGRIEDGSELFGTKSGNGFADLAQYDLDNNCWIDDADPIMKQLRLWMVDENGERLMGIAETGVGAIYLGQVYSPFVMRDEEDQPLGRIKSSSLALNENGSIGTVAQLDLCKRASSVQSEKPAEPLAQALMAV